MCLNCGCQMWDDDMGNPNNLTLSDLAKAAKASDQDAETTLKHLKEAMEKISKDDLQPKIDQTKQG